MRGRFIDYQSIFVFPEAFSMNSRTAGKSKRERERKKNLFDELNRMNGNTFTRIAIDQFHYGD